MNKLSIVLTLLEWRLIIVASFLSSLGNLCLKYSRLHSGSFFSPYFFYGLLCYGVNVLLFSKALSKIPISVAYPVFAGMGFLFLVLFSKIFLGEDLTASQWGGLGMILLGIWLVL